MGQRGCCQKESSPLLGPERLHPVKEKQELPTELKNPHRSNAARLCHTPVGYCCSGFCQIQLGANDDSNNSSNQSNVEMHTSSFSLPERLREINTTSASVPAQPAAVGSEQPGSRLSPPCIQTCTGLKLVQNSTLLRAKRLSFGFTFPFALRLLGTQPIIASAGNNRGIL